MKQPALFCIITVKKIQSTVFVTAVQEKYSFSSKSTLECQTIIVFIFPTPCSAVSSQVCWPFRYETAKRRGKEEEKKRMFLDIFFWSNLIQQAKAALMCLIFGIFYISGLKHEVFLSLQWSLSKVTLFFFTLLEIFHVCSMVFFFF